MSVSERPGSLPYMSAVSRNVTPGVDRGVEDATRALERLGLRAGAAEVVAAEADGGDEEAGGADAAQRERDDVMTPRYPAAQCGPETR